MASGASASDDLINHLHVEAEGAALDLVPPAAVDICKSSTPSPGCVYMPAAILAVSYSETTTWYR